MLSAHVPGTKRISTFMASGLEHGDTLFPFLLTFQIH